MEVSGKKKGRGVSQAGGKRDNNRDMTDLEHRMRVVPENSLDASAALRLVKKLRERREQCLVERSWRGAGPGEGAHFLLRCELHQQPRLLPHDLNLLQEGVAGKEDYDPVRNEVAGVRDDGSEFIELKETKGASILRRGDEERGDREEPTSDSSPLFPNLNSRSRPLGPLVKTSVCRFSFGMI